ncbi:MAG: hypothetical protein FJ137_07375 [Deltaproteobacteria bacterium]|nr:hypothetical protein [Deltaproteobacteria bacterium]
MRASSLLVGTTIAVVALAGVDASAYPWLINHGYAKCAACHVDPSGSGQLTQYGAALQDQAVRWHADPKELENGEPSPLSAALFGLPQPGWLNVSGNLRGGGMVVGKVDEPSAARAIPLLMATDVYATVNVESFVAHVAVGYGLAGRAKALVGPAAVLLLGDEQHALVSREHWVGMKFLDDALVVRAGRLPLPFGLRNYEHVSWVRSATRSDVNVGQQHGVAVAWQNDLFRTEVMGIAGNYQLRPGEYRERGYAGLFEWAPQEKLAIAASSKLTVAGRDLATGKPSALRTENGLSARWSPVDGVAILGEVDALVASLDGALSTGGVGWLQVDLQPVQGVHIQPAVETLYRGDGTEAGPAVGGWLSASWYPLVHTELRLDNYVRQESLKGASTPATFTSLLQVHLYL